MSKNKKNELKVDIRDIIGVVKDYESSWSKSILKVRYGDNDDTIDFRLFNNENNFIGKGISFSMEETDRLCDILVEAGFGTTEKLEKELIKRKKRYTINLEDSDWEIEDEVVIDGPSI